MRPPTVQLAIINLSAKVVRKMETKNSETQNDYWLGLEEYNRDPAFLAKAENEFMSSPLRENDGQDGFARREFLKLMGASVAMATTACIRRPAQSIIPYAQAPKELTPGIPEYYTSTFYDGSEGYGLLVKTLEGRPLKMEGNPEHPMNRGGLTARAHAEVLALYDPDRLRQPVRNLHNKTRTNRETVPAKWADIDAKVAETLKKGRVAILSNTLPSPSSRAIIADFLHAFPGTHVECDSLPLDAVREGQKRSYGRAILPRYRLDQAKFIVSIDCDFLGTYLSPAEFMKQYSEARKPGADMARMVVFESNMTLTGMNADDRVRIKPSQQLDVALALLAELGGLGANIPGSLRSFIDSYHGKTQGLMLVGEKGNPIVGVAKELWANRGKSVVMAGGLATQTAEAVELQVAVNLINSVLGNDGATIDHDVAPYNTYAGSNEETAKLIADLQAGKYSVLIVHGFNPMYNLPADSGLLEAMKKVELVLYTGAMNDETGRVSDYVIPAGYSFESWGDHEFQAGVYSLQQPTIRPLFDSRGFEESLHAWASKGNAPARVKAAASWYDYVRGIWKSEIHSKAGGGKGFEDFWAHALQSGVADASAGRRGRTGSARSFNASALSTKSRNMQTGYELVLYAKIGIGDGRLANIPWLQELPDPVTKVVWDNYLCVSPVMAVRESLQEGAIVALSVGDKTVEVPVHIQPGLHDEVLALAIGYGRSGGGKVCKDIGVNAYQLASFAAGKPVYSGLAAKLKPTGKKYDLVTTQHHHQLRDPKVEQHDRFIVAETTKTAFLRDPASGIHKEKVFSIWPTHDYKKHKWAMSIDLNACTGCSACVMACQSENNIPVVGKKYVMQGREMHWIRIDRYYKGAPEAPDVVFQPMTCQQCENAPCETVCPVLATVHSDDGLNDMVYNRCVGTRYCSNNCPYKVRRFNWFNFSKREEPAHMALNPDVTLRPRGVMEKCTFCVHRIRRGTNVARDRMQRDKNDRLRDGEIKTACEETCPTGAIVFGDLNDPESRVAKIFKDARSYACLDELNTVPRVRYQSKVRNADRVMPVMPHAPEHQKHESHKEGGHS